MNVLPRTLDVRQIRRTDLGMRKASGMESNKLKRTRSVERCPAYFILRQLFWVRAWRPIGALPAIHRKALG